MYAHHSLGTQYWTHATFISFFSTYTIFKHFITGLKWQHRRQSLTLSHWLIKSFCTVSCLYFDYYDIPRLLQRQGLSQVNTFHNSPMETDWRWNILNWRRSFVLRFSKVCGVVLVGPDRCRILRSELPGHECLLKTNILCRQGYEEFRQVGYRPFSTILASTTSFLPEFPLISNRRLRKKKKKKKAE